MLRALPAPMNIRSRQDSETIEEPPSNGDNRVDPTIWDTTKDVSQAALNISIPAAIVVGTFVPLVRQVVEIAFAVRELCNSARHNKDICNFVYGHVCKVVDVLGPLENSQGKENSYTEASYRALQHLKDTMSEIEGFIKNVSTTEGLTRIGKARRWLHGPTIKDRLNELTQKFNRDWQVLESAVNIASAKLLEERVEQLTRNSDRTLELVESMGTGIETVKIAVKKHNDRDLKPELFHKPTLDIKEYEQTNETLFDDRHMYKWVRRCDRLQVAFRAINYSSQGDEKRRFEREITILGMLEKSPDVAMYHGITEDIDKHYLVTEWPTYGSLRTYYTNVKELNWTTKLSFAMQIARGLSYLHAVDILHHDVRTDNVVVTSQEKVKLANFGLSRFVRDSTKNVARLRERVRYMAPEKLEDEKHRYNFECEVYSFGLLMWEIAELQRPFSEHALNDVEHGGDEQLTNNMRAQWLIRKKRPLDFSKNSRAPDDYKRMSIKAQQKNPSIRPRMFTILDELECLQRSQSETVMSPPSSTASSQPRAPCRSSSTDSYAESEFLPLDEALKHYKDRDEHGLRALQSLRKYASLDHTDATFHFAIYLLSTKDADNATMPVDAISWTDDTISDYQVNYETLDAEQLSKFDRQAIACKLLKKAADAGHAEAQCRYGTILMRGNTAVQKNIERARFYLGCSETSTDKNASYYLGVLYENEDNNMDVAVEYYRKAALMGVPQAIRTLEKKGIKLK